MDILQVKRSQIDELDAWQFTHPAFQATILCQGAQLIEFTPVNDVNWLWLSECAAFKRGQAVRGGIPICWPIFGGYDANPPSVNASFDKPLPAHGIARTSQWQLESVRSTINEVEISFLLTEDMSNLHLRVIYLMSQTELAVKLITINNGSESRTITQALHTYFPTSDIDQTQIDGFDQVSYVDLLSSTKQRITQQGAIVIQAETDRIYHASPDIVLRTPTAKYHLASKGSHSTVIWNPWREKAKVTSQMQAHDYQNMLCIETANVLDDVVTIAANAAHSLELNLRQQSD